MNYIDTQDLKNFSIRAKDGEIGHISDFYFDENLSSLRYFVADTESFLLRSLVLISPINFKKIDFDERIIEINITKKELEDSPSLDSVEEISRQYEKAYHDHFSWPDYWGYQNSAWAIGPNGIPRSLREVCSFSVKGTDNEEFGHIQGFILDPITLSTDFVIIDTINYLPSKNVLVRPEWIEKLSWGSKTVQLPFSKKLIKSAPSYKRSKLNQELIQKIDNHFKVVLPGDTENQTDNSKGQRFFRTKNEKIKIMKFSIGETVVGHIPSGLFVVTVQNSQTQEAEGFLASWVQQASFDPLLVSLCIKDGRPGIDEVLKKSPFCINVIGENDTDYLKYFTKNLTSNTNPLNKVPYRKIEGKGIILNDAKSAMICKTYEVSHPGDHYLVTAEVTDGIILNEGVSSQTYLREEGSHY